MSTNQKPAQQEQEVDLAAVAKSLQGGQTMNPDVTLGLLQLLMLRETRAAEKERANEVAQAAKEEGQKRDSVTYSQDMIRKQQQCRHLKGGKTRRANQAEDYNVYFHRFIDRVEWIKCNSCSAKWYPTDTKEFFVRGKRSYVNHTGIGWAEARMMAAKSSNQPSASESVLDQQPDVNQPKTPTGEIAANVVF